MCNDITINNITTNVSTIFDKNGKINCNKFLFIVIFGRFSFTELYSLTMKTEIQCTKTEQCLHIRKQAFKLQKGMKYGC